MLRLLMPCRRWVSSRMTARNLTTSAWKLPELYKDSIGLRTLIIAADDHQSQEYAKRMWYENQKIGIESGFYTVKSTFPNTFSIEEGLEIVRRTGVKSIITIGSSAICDIGKGIQVLLVEGLKTMNELDQQIVLKTAEVDTSRFQSNSKHSQNNIVSNGSTSYNNLSYPHFSMPLSVSTLYSRGDWSCLHKEDDVLVRRAGSAPKAVVFDSEVLESSVDFSNAATKSYLLSNLFDLFFFHFLNSHDSQILERNFSDDVKASRGVTDIATESMIIDTVKSSRIDHAALVKALSGNPSGTVEKEVEVEKDGQKKKEEVTEGSTADLSAAATAIVNLRRTMSDIPRTLPSTTATTSTSTSTSAAAVNQSTDPHPSPITTQDPRIAMQYSFIETVSLVYLLKSCQQGLSLPLPWVHSVALKSCLELILADKKRNPTLLKMSADEYSIVKASRSAVAVLCTLLDISETQLLENSKFNLDTLVSSKQFITKMKNRKNSKNVKKGPKGQNGQNGQTGQQESTQDGMSPAGLIEGWSVSEEMNLEKLNKSPSHSTTLRMLRCDFFLDTTEATFKYHDKLFKV